MATRGKLSKQYWECDTCSVEGDFDLHETNCQHPGCNAELCSGCTHECVVCDGEFCLEHIVAIPVSTQLHTAEYACIDCHSSKRQQQTQAA